MKKEEEEKAKKESLIEKNKMQFHKFGFKPVSASASTTVIEKKKATSGVDVEIPFSTPYLTPNEYTLLAKAPFGPSPERILYRSVDDSPAALDRKFEAFLLLWGGRRDGRPQSELSKF